MSFSIEAPAQIRKLTTRDSNTRSQRSTDLPEPEAFTPRASPVDIGGYAAVDNTAGQVLDALERSLTGATTVLNQASVVTQREAQRGADTVGAASSWAEMSSALGGDPEARAMVDGMNPFARAGAEQRLGRNYRKRQVSGWGEAIRQENARRAEAGEDPLVDLEERLAWMQAYYAPGNIEGNDDFRLGYADGLVEDIDRLRAAETQNFLVRQAETQHESYQKAASSEVASVIEGGLDPADLSISNSLSFQMDETITEAMEINGHTFKQAYGSQILGIEQELRGRIEQGEIPRPLELESIERQALAVAGDNAEAKRSTYEMFDRLEAQIASEEAALATNQVAIDKQNRKAARSVILQQLATPEAERDNEAYSQALATLWEQAPSEAASIVKNGENLLATQGIFTEDSVAFTDLLIEVERRGLGLGASYEYAASRGITMTAERQTKIATAVNQADQRGRISSNDSVKAAVNQLSTLGKSLGRSVNPTTESGMLAMDAMGLSDRDLGPLFGRQSTLADVETLMLNELTELSKDPDSGYPNSGKWRELVQKVRKEYEAGLTGAAKVSAEEATRDGFLDGTAFLKDFTRDRATSLRAVYSANRGAAESAQASEDATVGAAAVEAVLATTNATIASTVAQSFSSSWDPEIALLNPVAATMMHGILDADQAVQAAGEAIGNVKVAEPTVAPSQAQAARDTGRQPTLREAGADFGQRFAESASGTLFPAIGEALTATEEEWPETWANTVASFEAAGGDLAELASKLNPLNYEQFSTAIRTLAQSMGDARRGATSSVTSTLSPDNQTRTQR